VKSLGLDSNSPVIVELDRRWQFLWAFVAAFVLLIAIAGYAWVQNERAAGSRALLANVLAIQSAVLDMSNRSALMELHQRGFLLTGDPYALRLRDAAHASGRVQADRLQRLLAGDSVQADRAHLLSVAFGERYARMRQVSDVAKQQGLQAARAAFPLRGDGSVGPVLDSLASIREHQEHLLREGTARANAEQAHFALMLTYGTGFAMLVLAFTALSLLRQLARNQRLGKQLVHANQRQAEKAAELERSNRGLEAFSYTISHDLRAPLRHVDGYARMLQEDAAEQLTPDMRRYLDAISDSSRHMGMLIDDLLAYSRLGRKPLERVTLDMEDLVRRALVEAGAERSLARIHVGALPTAEADPVLMRQAWVNLLSNAIKYSAPKGADARIEVSGERDGKLSRYRIRDTGVGFDMRYADKLFGVFQRLHSQEEFEGTGVGLAIVQQVMERHGGRVAAEAVPGEGATFMLEIPAAEPPGPGKQGAG
jgi:signal transduction histidine kinase